MVAVAAAIRHSDTNLVSGLSLLHLFVFNLDAVNDLFQIGCVALYTDQIAHTKWLRQVDPGHPDTREVTCHSPDLNQIFKRHHGTSLVDSAAGHLDTMMRRSSPL
jgi:hypothetical protein